MPYIQKKHLPKNGQPTHSRVGCGSHFEGLVRSGLWAALSGPQAKLLLVLSEFTGLQVSYSALQRFTGVGRARIRPALDHFERMGLLKATLGPIKDGLRSCSSYELTWDDTGLERLMRETFAVTSREVQAERELRESERAQRRAALHSKGASKAMEQGKGKVPPSPAPYPQPQKQNPNPLHKKQSCTAAPSAHTKVKYSVPQRNQ